MEEEGLDRERVEGMVGSILLVIKGNYVRGPESRERCLEALNALAASAALVILGSDGSGGEARRFFEKAFEEHLQSKEEMKPEYLIWSNEHNAWWGPGRMGYTTEPSEAGRYSFEEASQICEDANRYSREVQERMILIVEGGASEGQ